MRKRPGERRCPGREGTEDVPPCRSISFPRGSGILRRKGLSYAYASRRSKLFFWVNALKTIFSGKIITVPNLLSFFRILLIPFFMRTYLIKDDSVATALILLISGLTDMVDGWIARRFDMVSNLGKALDPVADKLTQLAMMACLVSRFRHLWAALGALCIKELAGLVSGLLAIRKTNEVLSADWHGKVTTAVLYAVLTAHLIFPGMSPGLSDGMILLSTCMILLSGLLYARRNIRVIRSEDETDPE